MINDKLKEIENLISNFERIDIKRLNELFSTALKSLTNHIDNYIGDYPTFIEPVYLEENVKIGDDVLLGPNVYIGKNCNIGDYVEISNSILFDNVKISENLTLENCIIANGCVMNFSNINFNKFVLKGVSESETELEKLAF
ncbi:MAG: NDP-sugar synthase [Promethearchaeota archaeon]|nr:MAG: NDP-sugar synthase [Candidatus Lokiarchaeota archaeon]